MYRKTLDKLLLKNEWTVLIQDYLPNAETLGQRTVVWRVGYSMTEMLDLDGVWCKGYISREILKQISVYGGNQKQYKTED